MFDSIRKPRLTRFEDLVVLVRELDRMGVSGTAVYQRIAEIGPVDLDLLADVLAFEAKASLPHRAAA
ncbi:MAG: hypothetical protein BroJett030_09870 [Alphaproteobacteria bacterium]|nr:MAG: hypothetical protein BroJett030_09870 [Alphaproteobacteria bacterium]